MQQSLLDDFRIEKERLAIKPVLIFDQHGFFETVCYRFGICTINTVMIQGDSQENLNEFIIFCDRYAVPDAGSVQKGCAMTAEAYAVFLSEWEKILYSLYKEVLYIPCEFF